MRSVLALAMMMMVGTALAAPSKQEVDTFAKQMGASLDEVLATQAQADAAEKAKKFEEAERLWTGVWQGGAMLRDHAKRAAAGGMFQDPMKFPTKAGTLTAKQYLAKITALSTTGDVRAAKASLAAANQRAEKAKRTVVQSATGLAGMLAKQLVKAKRLPADKAASARVALDGIEKSAASLVKTLGKQAPDVVKQLTAIGADAKTALAALPKPKPAAAPAKTVATKTAKPAGTQTTTRPGATQPAAQPEPEQPAQPAAAPAEPVCDAGAINCDTSGTPCCDGERCMSAGWIMVGDGYEADYYACFDPAIAPTPP